MTVADILIIIIYFVTVLGLGFWYRRKASKNLTSYFLGGRSMHWLPLAMSGSVATFDITGTMWIVSMLFLFGMKSMWIHWMWGIMMGAFFMSFMGKWVRRSKVMTAAEWMITRFGENRGGRIARTSYALVAVITLASFIGYAFQGIGKFASVYLPLPPSTCALLIISITTLYVIMGGLYSVVLTQVIQTVILTLSSILIAVVAYLNLTPAALKASLPSGWDSIGPVWQLPELAGTENAIYEFFGLLVIVWVLKGLLLNAGGPAQMYDFQLFLASRHPRDAAKVGAAWSFFLIARWGMAAGIALLALSGITNIADPERVMPVVLMEFLPAGVRGIVIAGLLAAFMSTFSATINSAASFIVRDLYQPFTRKGKNQKQLIRLSRMATVAVVAVGILIGFQARSISEIWNWMMMALGAGIIIPNVLRWYWWRLTGWGYAAGTLAGMILSIGSLLFPAAPMYLVFPPIVAGSLLTSVLVSFLTRAVDVEILKSFYLTVFPFGLWRPVKDKIGTDESSLRPSGDSPGRALVNTLLGMVAVSGYYLFPMYLTGHWHGKAAICLLAALIATIILLFTWYRHLPPADSTA